MPVAGWPSRQTRTSKYSSGPSCPGYDQAKTIAPPTGFEPFRVGSGGLGANGSGVAVGDDVGGTVVGIGPLVGVAVGVGGGAVAVGVDWVMAVLVGVDVDG